MGRRDLIQRVKDFLPGGALTFGKQALEIPRQGLKNFRKRWLTSNPHAREGTCKEGACKGLLHFYLFIGTQGQT
jgi:hypothetical protein